MNKDNFKYEFNLMKKCMGVEVDYKVIEIIGKSRCIAWVASGLSACPAEFDRRILQDLANAPGIFFSPLDFIKSELSNYLPILVTYRGRNLDIQAVAKKIVKSKIKEVIIITGFPKNRVEMFLREKGVNVKAITIPVHKEENRFVSVLASLALAGLGIAIENKLSKQSLDYHNIEEVWNFSIKTSKNICEKFLAISDDWPSFKWIVLGSGLSSPYLYGWQSAMAEAGLCTFITGDIKDYSHGKYLSAFREKNLAYLILVDEYNHNLADVMEKRFSKFFPVIKIVPKFDGLEGLIENLFIIFHTVSMLSKSSGLSIKNPPKTQEVAKWNNWGRINVS